MSEQRPWHRLFGLTWTDFCAGSGLTVSPEKDLSIKQQFLDLLLIREEGGPLPQPLPDGFDNLATYNILTFKSHREALTDWALEELIGHYVNYRKQSSAELDDLLPASDFRLYAVCVRFPLDLSKQVNLVPLGGGVYDLLSITRWLRIIVVQELAQEVRNAMLHLFSRPLRADFTPIPATVPQSLTKSRSVRTTIFPASPGNAFGTLESRKVSDYLHPSTKLVHP